MAEFFLELFCEEIPARMQAAAETRLLAVLDAKLKAAGLQAQTAHALSGPRRLACVLTGLPARAPDTVVERKGPKTTAPQAALDGFARSAGLDTIDRAETRTYTKKGHTHYVAIETVAGRETGTILAEIIPAIIRGFTWPKSMRSGAGTVRWVRPLRRIVCLFDGAVVPFTLDNITSSNVTEGHRLHGRGPFTIKDFADYKRQLSASHPGGGHVMLSRGARRDKICADIDAACRARGLEWVRDDALLEEVVGLAEWPVVILGDMDKRFLDDLPEEVIREVMRVHQRYFTVREGKTGRLAPHFIAIANIAASDGGKAITAGNARVLAARLADAHFFHAQDLKVFLAVTAGVKERAKTLAEQMAKLDQIVFKSELGTMKNKIDRMEFLLQADLGAFDCSPSLIEATIVDPNYAKLAATLCKLDLNAQMVREFPALQGIIAHHYMLQLSDQEEYKDHHAKDHHAIADSIRDHYRPYGRDDPVPTAPMSVTLAIADRIDTLAGFAMLNQLPGGTKDPFALRRAAIAVIRIIVDNGLDLNLFGLVNVGLYAHTADFADRQQCEKKANKFDFDWNQKIDEKARKTLDQDGRWLKEGMTYEALREKALHDLHKFLYQRLQQYLRDQGKRYDLVDAALIKESPGDPSDGNLTRIVVRVEALTTFLATPEGADLLSAHKRVRNILAAYKKSWRDDQERAVDSRLIEPGAERALYQALLKAEKDKNILDDKSPDIRDRFTAGFDILATLSDPINRFFDTVMVNVDDSRVRENRHALLAMINTIVCQFADFEKITMPVSQTV